MTEDFLSRWARRKRESTAQPEDRAEGQATDSKPTPLDSAPAAPIDPSGLPPVESISAESNVGAFLQAGVPEDLTRAALRSAWASDPTIRDFVGIAENQWDFNGEGTIAGFGSLSAEETARYMAARVLAAGRSGGTEPYEGEAANSPASNASTDCLAVPPTTNPSLPSLPLPQSPVVSSRDATSTAATAPKKRTHGSALPQ